MGEVIVITSGKGGVGKTTTTANLGSALAMDGKKVVLVDTDIGLRNLDVVMGLENRIVYDIVDVVEGKCKLKQALIKDKRFAELFLLPAAQTRDKSALNEEQMKDLMKNLKEDFDYVLVDCPAGIEQGFKNAITGADRAIVVTTAEISAIPRPSKKEEKTIEYLKEFGKKHQLDTQVDEAGNVLIKKAATTTSISNKTVALQSHVDMVCEKNSDVSHNFETEGIVPIIDGEWVKAKDTTLGADNGIGIAMMLAVLASSNIEHGNIECLFTVDEETGLSGAFALKKGFLNADILINLDSEDEKELFIGCSGGIDSIAVFNYCTEIIPADYFHFHVSVKGLKGGHSGEDIDKGLGNANKILNRFLWNLNRKMDLRICNIDGGNLRNAIAREASAIIAVPYTYKETVRVDVNNFIADIENEFAVKDPNVKIELESSTPYKFGINKNTSDKLLNALYACPHGVITMSSEMQGLVETSTNLASVKMTDNEEIIVTTSQRSSVESEKYDIMHMVESVFLLAGATISHSDGYPGWKPNPNSEILKITADCFTELFGEKPRIRAIHAGLECGLFLEKYPQLDMVSFGPTIQFPHSPSERVNIASVEKSWKLLCKVLTATVRKVASN